MTLRLAPTIPGSSALLMSMTLQLNAKLQRTCWALCMLKEKAYIESELGQRLIGWVSDASGESHAACKQLQNHFPQLLVVDCYAHQVGLILAVLRLSLFLIQHCRCS